MNKQEKETIKSCVKDIESIWMKIHEDKPMDHYDKTKLTGVIGALNRISN